MTARDDCFVRRDCPLNGVSARHGDVVGEAVRLVAETVLRVSSMKDPRKRTLLQGERG
jgi:hypothetical protein